MRQHSDATTDDVHTSGDVNTDNVTTTEDIAAVRQRPEPESIDRDHVDTDPADMDRAGDDWDEADRADDERVDGDRPDGVDRVEPQPVAVEGEAGRTTSRDAAPRETTDSAADVLFADDEAARFRARWREVQTAFVDDPKQAVQDADLLVAELMQELASAFSERKRVLEHQWQQGSEAQTEDLRLALRGYRSFVDQLLAH